MKKTVAFLFKLFLIITLLAFIGFVVFAGVLWVGWPWWVCLFIIAGIFGILLGAWLLKKILLRKRKSDAVRSFRR